MSPGLCPLTDRLVLITDRERESWRTAQRVLEEGEEKKDQTVIVEKCQISELLKEDEQDNQFFLNVV